MFDYVILEADALSKSLIVHLWRQMHYHNFWLQNCRRQMHYHKVLLRNFEGRSFCFCWENWFVDFHLAAVSTNQEYSSQSLISSYFIGVIISIEHLELAGSDGRSLFGWLWHVGSTSWLQIICNQQRETSATKIKTFSNSQKYFLTNL